MEKNKKKKYLFEYNMVFLNILCIIFFLILMLLTYFIELNINGGFLENLGKVLIEFFNGNVSDFKVDLIIWTAFFAMVLWLCLHEVIHGIFYRLGGAKKEDITYGADLSKSILYCKCSNYVNKKAIMMSLLAPFMIIGVFTYVIGLIFKIGLLVFLSIINICGSCADLAMFIFFIKRDKNLRFKELGDSTTFCLETNEDLVGKKFLIVKLKKVIANEKEIFEEKSKKITITKSSWIILIVFIVLFLLCLLLNIFI